MYLLAGQPDSTGGCQSALVEKLGVSPSRYRHTMVHIANRPEMNNRPVEAAVLRRQSHPIIANLPIAKHVILGMKVRFKKKKILE
jgi:hypothetical protein